MTFPAFTWRTATNADLGALRDIHVRATREVDRRLGPGHWSLVPTDDVLLSFLECRTVFLACLGGAPVATVACTGTPASFWPEDIWEKPHEPALCVFGMAVLPRCQRRGIGSWMVDHLEDEAFARGLRWLRLDAYSANPRAVSFYLRNGFCARGEIRLAGTTLTCLEKPVTAPATPVRKPLA